MRINTIESTPDYLKMTALFSELSALELDILPDNVRYRTIRKGDVIDYNRKDNRYVYLILSGVLKLGEDIASLLSTTRITVTNILNQLRESGSINYGKKQVEIFDVH